MKPLVLSPRAESQYSTADFSVSIYGPTDAFITESLCVAYIYPEQAIEQPALADRVMFPIHDIGPVIRANSQPLDCYAFLDTYLRSDNPIVTEIREKRMFVGIRGFIKYKDVFDRARETTFRYVWRYNEIPGFAETEYGDWVKCGRPEENQET